MKRVMRMEFDFDNVLERNGTGSRKWDGVKEVFGAEVLPLWIADMDFSSPPAVTKALLDRAAHPIYAYNTQEESLYEAIIDWNKRRHGWEISRECLILTPGVVPALTLSLYAFTQEGEGVIIQPPVYPPFFELVKDNGREVVENPLRLQNGRYEIDFSDLEAKMADPKNKLLLFCSPHNPTGRVWSREELTAVAELARRYSVTVLADEIHSDIVYGSRRHLPLASLETAVAENVVTFMAASKTFNVAGLNLSYVAVPCPEKRKKLDEWIGRLHLRRNNLFGVLATEAAYRAGDVWLDELLHYLEDNAEYAVRFLQSRLPEVSMVKPEGTYLLWLDFRRYFADSCELDRFMVQEAKVGLNSGRSFGLQGDGFVRLNIATSRSILREALERIERALKKM